MSANETISDAVRLGDSPSDSSTGVLYLPPTFLDALIPGYSVLARALLDFGGIDISFYVSLCALVFVVHAAWNFTIAPFSEVILKHITSHVYIDEYDDIYDQLLNWVRAHKLMADLRSLRAESQGRYYDYDEDEQNVATDSGPGVIFNFNDWAARAAPRYEPYDSSGFFCHRGYFYRIIRNKEKVQEEWGPVREREKLIVSVLWRSTLPIKALIEDSREFYLGSRTSRTRIYRPVAREERSTNNEWHVVAIRPSRPVSTVVLDDEPKAEILLDLNEFLTPQTARWYANRGIPYRRGYLFHGPPGTGKSSMSFSLAGLFGLNIYCLSLSEITLTEESLIVLFNTLPKRCLVLLEDIDSAGVSRPKPPSGEKSSKPSKKRKGSKKWSKKDTDSSSDGDEVVVSPGAPKKLTNAISISGLLNAIDGVASQEGRILIMTTNHPERLDDALVRPGRVDMQIKFDLASRRQIKELFLRMYSADSASSGKQPTCIAEAMPHMDMQRLMDQNRDLDDDLAPSQASDVMPVAGETKENGCVSTSLEQPKSNMFDASLAKLAEEFANALPGNTFSPAEVQGYLLMRKNRPKKAVAEIAAFRGELLAKKKAREEPANEAKVSRKQTKVKQNEGTELDEAKDARLNDEAAVKRLVNGDADRAAGKDKKKAKARKPRDGDSSGSESGSGTGSTLVLGWNRTLIDLRSWTSRTWRVWDIRTKAGV